MRFTIIGAGIAGLTAAIGLQKLGLAVTIYEAASVLKGIGAGFGLAANAMQGFDYLGIKEDILKIGHHLPSYEIKDANGKALIRTNTRKLAARYAQENFAIHRADLHQYLRTQIDPNLLHLGKKALSFQQIGNKTQLYFEDGSSVETDYLLIADGIKSPLRQQLLPDSTPRYAGYTCWRATIDNAPIQLTEGSETWGSKGRFGMTPLVGNKIYWYACINAPANSEKHRNFTVADLQHNFASYHSPIPKILDATPNESLLWNDIIDIKPLKHFAFGPILLLGDAAHATTPNMGQGACQAIEDVVILMEELRIKQPIEQAFKNFEKRRLQRTKYITETSKFIGEVSQWEHPALIGVRNALMRILPESISQRSLHKLFEVDFMNIK